jgi:hypothetical protein
MPSQNLNDVKEDIAKLEPLIERWEQTPSLADYSMGQNSTPGLAGLAGEIALVLREIGMSLSFSKIYDEPEEYAKVQQEVRDACDISRMHVRVLFHARISDYIENLRDEADEKQVASDDSGIYLPPEIVIGDDADSSTGTMAVNS